MTAGERVLIGAYSGPGADGVDLAVLAAGGQGDALSPRQIHHAHRCYPESLRRRVLSAVAGHADSPLGYAELDRDVGVFFAEAVDGARTDAGVAAESVAAVGCSGQRIALAPPRGDGTRRGAALCLGGPGWIAAGAGLPAVGCFEAADLAAGGRGGPLTPWADWVLLRDGRLSRVLVHLGGLVEITGIPADAAPSDLIAADAGPAGLLLDRLASRFLGQPCDSDGAVASRGAVHHVLLNELLAHPYFQKPAPKTARLDDWDEGYLWRVGSLAERHGCVGADLLATATEMVAHTAAAAVAALRERPHEVILAGGGSRNIHLAGRIRKLLSPSSTYTAERYGLSLRSARAAGYAVLAAARLDGRRAGLPGVTGASRPALLGDVAQP